MKGIGTDIVQVSRMRDALERQGDQFAERILTEAELKEYRPLKQRAHFLAKRFAAKEAVAKAFGTGFREGLWFTDITVSHDEKGKPLLQFSGKALEIANDLNITEYFVSISDEKDYAVAFVVLI